MKQKRIISILMAVVLLISLGITANAEYDNDYKNSGNYRTDIVAVAETQLGYVEGANNNTKYGEWYGESNIAWSAIFISWCAAQADIPTTVIPKFANCDAGKDWFVSEGCWNEKESYTPQAGDIVFYDWDDNGTPDHVGIVQSVNGDEFTAIEGNYSDKVDSRGNIKIDSQSVLGFASPNYTEDTTPEKAWYECIIDLIVQIIEFIISLFN